jgi:hypothetical protein
MRVRNKRWAWFSQTVDALLVVAGLTTIGAMIYRWSFPAGAIALAAFCVGGLTAGQLIDLLVGRWTGRDNGKP